MRGDLRAGLAGADVFVGVSGPGLLNAEWIQDMADDAVVFALANPDPEVDPAEAGKYAAVVASGRSDYPNQINNVLAFPGVFRGLLDARASEITVEMLAAGRRGDRAGRPRRGAQPQLHHPVGVRPRRAEGGRRGDPRALAALGTWPNAAAIRSGCRKSSSRSAGSRALADSATISTA